MTTLTAEEAHLIRLKRQQEQTIRAALARWQELNSQLIELRQQAQDNRPAMRAMLAVQGRAAVAAVEQLLNTD